MYGYGGKLLFVDLSTGKVSKKELDEGFARKYVGGNGFGARLLYDNVRAKIDPLGPDNCLIFAPGAFCGTPVPEASKSGFYAKSPLTGAFGEAMLGSGIGPELKFAGYDALIVKGMAKNWSYLWIDDEEVKIEDASHLVGRSTSGTLEDIRKDRGDMKIMVACIGPAGENLVKFASIESDFRQAGRTGLGAVMGSKRLKAIAVRGSGDLKLADPELMEKLLAEWYGRISTHPHAIADIKYGTGEFIGTLNEVHGVFPTRNWQDSVFEGYRTIAPQYWIPKYSIKTKACHTCIKPCGKVFVIKDGPYAGVVVDGPEFETQYSLGGCVGNADPEVLAKANAMCDELGLDTISAGVVIAWAMECYERGLLTSSDTGGLRLNFGNPEAILGLLEMIAKRKGIGNLLAEGVREASRRLGRGSENFAVHVKGLEPPAYDARGLKGMGLAYAVSTRGACHLRSCAYAAELSGGWWKFRRVDRLSAEGKAYVKTVEDIMTVYDTVGICKFSRHFYFIEELPDFFKAVHGYNFKNRELLKLGERVYNLEKAFNVREGFNREHDTLPPRMMNEPIREGGSRGSVITREELDRMLDDYYDARGWDKNGIPTRAKLEELGLEDIAEDLGLR
ncbi:MAG: aldehyde ferredoxin oxidoreductase family protein [Candidatus Hadarchaeales archaeon]